MALQCEHHLDRKNDRSDSASLDSLIEVIDSAMPSVTVHQKHPSLPHAMSKPWVLCIDDDEDLTDALRIRLYSRGFEVVRAYTGMTGFRYAFEFEPVAILLDLCMPGASGEEILGRLQRNIVTSQIPTIIMTGKDEPGLKQRLLAAGASDFFRKPIPHDLLVEVVSYYSGGAGREPS